MVRKMRAWDAAPVERDLMKLLVEKVENRVGGRSGSKIQREIKRVLSTHAKADGWLEAPTLARALQATWLVGLEQGEVLNFCDGLAARMPGGKLSCDRFAREVAAAAAGDAPAPPPSRGAAPGERRLDVATPDAGSYHNPVQVQRATGGSDVDVERAKALKIVLRDELERTARAELGAWTADDREVRKTASSALLRRCRALCERGAKRSQRRLALAQWCVALRGLAVAAGLPAPADAVLAALWAACDRGDYGKFARDLFEAPRAPPDVVRGGREAAAAAPGASVAVDSPPPSPSWLAPEASPRGARVLGGLTPVRVHGLGRPGAEPAAAAVAYFPPTRTVLFACGSSVVVDDLDEDDGQRVYCGHAEAVGCVAAHATRPVACSGDSGAVHVWRLRSLEVLQVLGRGLFRGVRHVAFLGGHALAAAGADGGRDGLPFLAVFDSETGDVLGEHLVSCGRGGEVKCLASCPTDATTFGTAGDGHVAFWTLERSGGLREAPGRFGAKVARAATTHALAFSCTAPGVAFSGGSNGRVYVWRDGVCLASFDAHGKRPVRSLSCAPGGDAVLSAGDDGAVRRWAGPRLSAQGDCAIVASKRPASADAAAAVGAAVSGVVYARCLDGDGAAALAATARGTLMTVDVTTEAGKRGAVDGRKIRSLVVEGHVGAARDVAAHPTDGATFATCGDDRRVVTWALDRKLKHATLPRAATALTYSEPSGASLVVGLEDGTVHFLDAESLDDAHGFEALRETAVTALAFSPDGDLLAVGARSGKVLLFDPRRTAKPLASLSGHHAAVEALDFGVEGSGLVVLRSQDAAGELFYWAVDGKASRRLTRRDDLDDHASWRWKSWTARDAKRGIDAVDRANGRDAYVVADADGLELRSAPAAAPDGPPDELRRGVVHTTKVARLAFLADDAHVVSLAKGDRAVVVWAAEAGDGYGAGENYSPGPSSASPAYLEAEVSQDDDAENFPPDAEEDGDWPF